MIDHQLTKKEETKIKGIRERERERERGGEGGRTREAGRKKRGGNNSGETGNKIIRIQKYIIEIPFTFTQ